MPHERLRALVARLVVHLGEASGSRRIWSNASAAVSVAFSSRSFFAAASRSFAIGGRLRIDRREREPGELLLAARRGARGAAVRRRGSPGAARTRASPAPARAPAARLAAGAAGAAVGARLRRGRFWAGLRLRRRLLLRRLLLLLLRRGEVDPELGVRRGRGEQRGEEDGEAALRRQAEAVARVMGGLTGADGCGSGRKNERPSSVKSWFCQSLPRPVVRHLHRVDVVLHLEPQRRTTP